MQIFMFNGLFNGIKGTGIGMLLGLALVFSLNPILIMLNVPIALSGDGTCSDDRRTLHSASGCTIR